MSSNASPQKFGKYLLLRRIALGGMAEIFTARHAGGQGSDKDIIIKRILPAFSGEEDFVKMFVDEAALTSKLQHPNIVQITDFDVVDECYFIAMEYIQGKDLKDVISESNRLGDPLSVAQCVWIAIEVAKGLHYAHTKEDKGVPLNIVHRDVTPSNVMISYRGDVKLMDFGIAKAAQRITKTQAGLVKGKVAYMSPEQARGKALDGRSDVWALGVMLWEMLARQRLFAGGSDFETLTNVLKLEPPLASSKNPDVPSELDALVSRGLAKNLNERWESAEQMGRELTRWYFSNVTDVEKEKLKPMMHRIFKRDIDILEQNAQEDEAMVSGKPVTRPKDTESTSMQESASAASADAQMDQSTRMIDAVDDAQPPGRAAKPATSAERSSPTVRPRTSTSTIAHRMAEEAGASGSPRSPVLWIVIGSVVLFGGLVALFLSV